MSKDDENTDAGGANEIHREKELLLQLKRATVCTQLALVCWLSRLLYRI